MPQLILACVVALILVAFFSGTGDGAVKHVIGTVLFWLVAGAIVLPVACWLLATFGILILQVIAAFVVLRWLLAPSPGRPAASDEATER